MSDADAPKVVRILARCMHEPRSGTTVQSALRSTCLAIRVSDLSIATSWVPPIVLGSSASLRTCVLRPHKQNRRPWPVVACRTTFAVAARLLAACGLPDSHLEDATHDRTVRILTDRVTPCVRHSIWHERREGGGVKVSAHRQGFR
jgi:hypothetical protein